MEEQVLETWEKPAGGLKQWKELKELGEVLETSEMKNVQTSLQTLLWCYSFQTVENICGKFIFFKTLSYGK